MIASDVLKKHEKRCNEILEEMTEHIISGRCADYAEYRNLVGKIRGMEMSFEVLDDAKHSDEDEEDEV